MEFKGTIYAGDNPGSSTVDPVDPNQVVVTLKGDELTIRESSGEEIMMALSLNQGDASVPAFNRVQRTQSFQNELTVTLTEEGLYRLELSNPSWGYYIFGTFNYPQRKDAIDQTDTCGTEDHPKRATLDPKRRKDLYGSRSGS